MVAMPATVCAMLSDSAFCLSVSSSCLRTVMSVMVPMSRAGSPSAPRAISPREWSQRTLPSTVRLRYSASKLRPLSIGMAQGMNDRLEVLAVHGREPVIAVEEHTV